MVSYLIAKHKRTDREDKEQRQKLRVQKERLDRKIERIREFLEKSDPKPGRRIRQNKSNITDNESAKMASSRGVIQGYNGLALTDGKHQIVVSADAFGNVCEHEYLGAMVEGAKQNLRRMKFFGLGLKSATLLADTNHFSEDNCRFLLQNGIDGYIPDHGFRVRDPRYPENKEEQKKRVKYRQEDFRYDEKDGCYYCPMGKRLTLKRKGILFHGYCGDRYQASILDCRMCVNHYRCLNRQAKSRTLFVTTKPKKKTWSVKMREKIDTEEGRDMYARRMGIVEPVFAHITYHKKLNRFTLRGRTKVKIQWLLYMLVHNIQKIKQYGKGEIKKIEAWQVG